MAKFVIDSEEVFEVVDAARLMNMSAATLWRRIKEKKVVPLQLSGRVFITQSEIDRYNAEIKK